MLAAICAQFAPDTCNYKSVSSKNAKGCAQAAIDCAMKTFECPAFVDAADICAAETEEKKMCVALYVAKLKQVTSKYQEVQVAEKAAEEKAANK